MKSNKLTRTEDFISSACATKSHFVQNQAILFALINLASQITSTSTEGDCTTQGKGVQVNEHVIFSKLVPQELFLIQSIQNQRKSHYTIVRPLINCSRHIITMACIVNRLPVYPDITNKKVRYSRNRIRKQVLPSLQFFFNPEIEKALFKFSEFYKTA